MEWMPALVAAIGGTVTLAGLFLARRQNRAQATKSEADASQVIVAAARDAIELSVGPLKTKVAEQDARIESLESRVAAAETDRDVLAALVRRLIEWEDNGRPDPPGPPTSDAVVRALLGALPDR